MFPDEYTTPTKSSATSEKSEKPTVSKGFSLSIFKNGIFAKNTPKMPAGIPPLIHFIWMGNPPSDAALENILAWAKRAKNTAWKIYLWTDSGINKGKWDLRKLSGKVEVKAIRDFLDPKLEHHYSAAVDRKYQAFNMASDIARYSILQQLGGAYIDVDLGPGEVDLAKVPILSADHIPVVSPQVRDKAALKEQLKREEIEGLSFSEQVNLAASRAYTRNQLNNNLIVIGKQSKFMACLIDYVAKKMESPHVQSNPESWADLAASITGPQAMIITMFEMPGVDGKNKNLVSSMEAETFMNWSKLQWLTKESENQKYDTDDKILVEGKSSNQLSL